MSRSDFRKFIPPMGTALHYGKNHRVFLDAVRDIRIAGVKNSVDSLLATPYKGITTDGNIIPGLFELRSEGAPTRQMVDAATNLWRLLTPEQREVVFLPIESRERQLWQNSIAHWEDYGLRFDEMPVSLRGPGLAVIEASLSPKGFEKFRTLVKLNAFLGDLVGAPDLLGEWNYQLHFFGEPSMTEPWGWQWSGHHLTFTCFIIGDQMTLTPIFMGAEPRYVDEGRFAGLTSFEDEEHDGLQFGRSLSPEQKRKAVFSESLLAQDLPPGRHDRSDGLTRTGSYGDNRIVPYEGILGADLTAKQRQDLLDLARCYMDYLPYGPLQARMTDLEKHILDTQFCWAGRMEETSVFYYRIQSPVVLIEFDHHRGTVLKNPTPEKFHIHSIIRTPNGNDYGMDLLRLHYETAAHHRHADLHATNDVRSQEQSHDRDQAHDHASRHSHPRDHVHRKT